MKANRERVTHMSTQTEAAALVQKHRDIIDYFVKFGSSLERAMAQVVLEAAKSE